MTRGLMIAAPRSGSGKTTAMLGLLRAFRRRGVEVVGLKSGPDYIDPAFHAAASGREGVNLDSWAMAPPLLLALAAQAAETCALALCEASMGLFDGVPAERGRSGASADVAAALGLPVLLVIDASGQAQSAALPERHLGLVQAGETEALEARLGRIADFIEAHVDCARVLGLASGLDLVSSRHAEAAVRPPGQRIALARDAAFSFIYPHLTRGWRAAGAEIVPFSPLADEPPPRNCDVCWFPGGYPELHAGRLATAARFREGIRRFAETAPVHGECGGYMALGASLTDASGEVHPMAGLLGVETSFEKRRMTLGYREARIASDSALGRKGALLRGHEFHYATVVNGGGDDPFAFVSDAYGSAEAPSGSRRGRVTGSFFHVIAEA
jgi:cobyrinic acid a,c-diamide synthase